MFFKKAIQAIVLCGVVLTAGVAPSASRPGDQASASKKLPRKWHWHVTSTLPAKGWKVNIAVLDDGGGLLYFRRHPGAFRGSVDISINKAWTATQFGFPTRFFGSTIVNAAPGIQYTPRLIIFPGGLPDQGRRCAGGWHWSQRRNWRPG